MGVRLEDIVSIFYRRILLREPDPSGYQNSVSNLKSGTMDVDGLLGAILTSEEFKSNLGKFARVYGTESPRLTNDHSQYGEFFELLKLIVDRGAPSRIVVDVGANGRERSNSYDLLRHFGWKGLLIEANPALREQINADFKGLDYTLVSVAVSDVAGEGALSLGVNSDISSLSPEYSAAWGPISGSIAVPVRRLPEILAEYGIPNVFDVLSLDIEGYDARVLNDLILNSAFRPKWVIIEGSHNFAVSDPTVIGVSGRVCEEYTVSAQTLANLILSYKAATRAAPG